MSTAASWLVTIAPLSRVQWNGRRNAMDPSLMVAGSLSASRADLVTAATKVAASPRRNRDTLNFRIGQPYSLPLCLANQWLVREVISTKSAGSEAELNGRALTYAERRIRRGAAGPTRHSETTIVLASGIAQVGPR
jgi:hypothetical protein